MDLSKTGKPSSRSRETAYRAIVAGKRRALQPSANGAKPSVLRAMLEEFGFVEPVIGGRPKRKGPVRVAALREQRK